MNFEKILLTGATGFVGNKVIRVLQGLGKRVRVVIRPESFTKLINPKNLDSVIYSPDIFAESADWWAKACEGIDTFVHIAWITEPGKYLYSSANLDCLQGTLQMAKGAAKGKIRRFVGIGTCFEYDVKQGMLSTDTPLRPLTPYAGTKAAVFMSLAHWLPLNNIQFAWCRLFYLYGKGEDSRRFVSYVRSKLESGQPAELTEGYQIRDFLEAEEAAHMICEIILSEKTGAFNICSGVPITIRQFAEKLADEYGRRDLLIFGAREENIIDPPCVVGIR